MCVKTYLKRPKHSKSYDIPFLILEFLITSNFEYTIQQIARQSHTPQAYEHGNIELATIVGLRRRRIRKWTQKFQKKEKCDVSYAIRLDRLIAWIPAEYVWQIVRPAQYTVFGGGKNNERTNKTSQQLTSIYIMWTFFVCSKCGNCFCSQWTYLNAIRFTKCHFQVVALFELLIAYPRNSIFFLLLNIWRKNAGGSKWPSRHSFEMHFS